MPNFIEEQPLTIITPADLVGVAQKMNDQKQRLVQISATRTAEAFELNYSFDDNYTFSNYRIVLTNNTDAVIPSISKIYPTAFLYENEMHDLYGITVSDMAIDFKGTFYRTAVKTPFATKGATNNG